MNFESLVADVRQKMQPYLYKGQEVAVVSMETAKAANVIVVDSVQTLFKSNVAVGKDLVSKAQESFEKARLDGLKAVMSAPMSYVPDSRDTVVGAYADSVMVLSKTGDKLAKVAIKGYEGVSKKLSTAPKKASNKRSATKSAAPTKKASPAKKSAPKSAASGSTAAAPRKRGRPRKAATTTPAS